MHCSHCHAHVENGYHFCPLCGYKLIQESAAPGVNQNEAKSPPTVQKKRMPFWFKLLSFLSVLALIIVTLGILFTESLVDVIYRQLNALHHQDISKAYSYTSKDFQSSTSLDQFKHFIEAYPVFLNNQSAHFTQRSVKHNIGILKGQLTSQEHLKTPIEYRLIKEEGKWKILSIRLLQPALIPQNPEAAHGADLIEAVKGQLSDIQAQNVIKAYDEFASKEFKAATSIEDFQEFIKRYPIFSRYSSLSFEKPSFHNGVGILSVVLQSGQSAAYVKFYLIYEDSKWKVWSLRLLSPNDEDNHEQKSLTDQNTPHAAIR